MSKKKGKSKTLPCPGCGKRFKAEPDLQNHITSEPDHKAAALPSASVSPATAPAPAQQTTTAVKPQRTPWACHICCQFLDSFKEFELHYKGAHFKDYPQGYIFIYCAICGAFVLKEETHARRFPKHPKCASCDSAFDKEGELRKHIRLRNTCEACKIHHATRQALQEHNERVHFSCGACDARFATLGEKVQHRL